MPNGYRIEGHPETGNPVVRWPGGFHGLGCKPRKLAAPGNDGYPPLDASFDVPPDQWTEQDFRPFAIPVQDQGQSSGCGGFALVEAMGTAFALAGDERPVLSGWAAYGGVNGGEDGGSALPDLLREAETAGVPRAELVQAGNMFGPYSQAAYVDAKRWRIEAAYDTPTWAKLCSACEHNQTGILGVDIGINFNPDSQGVLPPYQQGPKLLGHALSLQGKKLIRGAWHLLVQNHWTRQWGMAGFAYMPESYLQPMFGAWAVKVIRPDPNDPNAPPSAT